MKNTTLSTFTGISSSSTLSPKGGLIIKNSGKKLWKKLYSNLFGDTVNEIK